MKKNAQKIINGKKHCSCCGKLLLLNYFTTQKDRSSGYGGWCKNCYSEYRKKNKNWIKERNRKWYQKNKEKLLERGRQYYQDNKEERNIYQKEYHQKYPEKYTYQKNKKKSLERSKRWLENPQNRLSNQIGGAIYTTLRGNKNGRRWEFLVDYTLKDLMTHLENQFTPEMNWNNYGSYWHIDHIIPKSWFEYNVPEDKEFKRCWALSNLQPLEAKSNCSKFNRAKISDLIRYCLGILNDKVSTENREN
jgi:hypothetical protein